MSRVLTSVVLLELVAGVVLAPEAEATIRVWNGAGGNALWRTAANWNPSGVPGAADVATFDGSCSSNCSPTIDQAIDVGGINMVAGYAGTVSQAAPITVEGSNFSQAAGTFLGGSQAITVNGSFTLSGGSFRSTTGVLTVSHDWRSESGVPTFVSNGGTVSLTSSYGYAPTHVAGSIAFNNLVVGASGLYGGTGLTMSGTTTVAGNLSLTRGTYTWDVFSGGTLEVSGDVSVDADGVCVGAYGPGSAVIRLVGAGDQTIAGNAAGRLPSIRVDKPSGTVFLTGTLIAAANWTWNAGSLNAGASTLVVHGGHNAQVTITPGVGTYNNVTIETSGDSGTLVSIAGTFRIGGDVILRIYSAYPGGTIDNGSLVIGGNLLVNRPGGGTTMLSLNGAGSQTLSQTPGSLFLGTEFTVNKPSGSAVLASDFSTSGALTITSGTLSQGAGFNLTVNGALTIGAAGLLYNAGSGDLAVGGNVSNAGTVTFNGGGNLTCADDADSIVIGSTPASVVRTWSGTGTFSFEDVRVSYQTKSGTAVTAYNSTNGGNNSNWTFLPCGPDAGQVDAGATSDAGSADAGAIADAGSTDGGSIVDAGSVDAGPNDGGGAGDAGVAEDAGTVIVDGSGPSDAGEQQVQRLSVGCDCNSTAPSLSVIALLVIGRVVATLHRRTVKRTL